MPATLRNALPVLFLVALSSFASAQLNPVAPFTPSTVGPTLTGTGAGHATGGAGGALVTLEAQSSATDAPEGSHLISRISDGILPVGAQGAIVEIKSELKGSLIIGDINDPADEATVDATVDFGGAIGVTNAHHFQQSVLGAQAVFETQTPLLCLAPGDYPVDLDLTAWAKISDEVVGTTEANSSNFSAVTGDFFRVTFTEVFEGTVYCTAGTSAKGCQAMISAGGTASATESAGFYLKVGTVEGKRDGLFFFGSNGQQANSWGTGTSFQCVVPPVKRAGILNGIGTVGNCDGWFCQDFNAMWCPTCPAPAKNPGVGATVQAQFWYRDPLSTSNQTTSMSDAVQFTVAP